MITIEELKRRAKLYELLCVAVDEMGGQVLELLRLVARDNSQTDLAHILRVSPQYLNDVINERRPINRALNKRILASFVEPGNVGEPTLK